MASVIVALIRGTAQFIAAASGLLLVFGVIYAMEGMTSRLPMGSARELVTETVFMLPWTLVFCSAFHDLSMAAKREWIFWVGSLLTLGFLYYLNRHTTDTGLTKVAMPVFASAAAIVPHALRRLAFIYSVLSGLFALCGVVVFYLDVQTFITGSSFATPAIAVLMVIFPLAAITAGTLLIAPLFYRPQAVIHPR